MDDFGPHSPKWSQRECFENPSGRCPNTSPDYSMGHFGNTSKLGKIQIMQCFTCPCQVLTITVVCWFMAIGATKSRRSAASFPPLKIREFLLARMKLSGLGKLNCFSNKWRRHNTEAENSDSHFHTLIVGKNFSGYSCAAFQPFPDISVREVYGWEPDFTLKHPDPLVSKPWNSASSIVSLSYLSVNRFLQ